MRWKWGGILRPRPLSLFSEQSNVQIPNLCLLSRDFYGLPSVTDQRGNNIVSVNTPRFSVIPFYCRHADVAFAIICHCREPPISEAEPRSLFNFVCCHVMVFSSWFLMGILPVILPLSLRENGREKRPSQ